MAMKTQVKKMGDTVVIDIDGKLDYEIQDPLREQLHAIADTAKTDSVAKKIVFNLEGLEFVGSSGISVFIQTLKEINAQSDIKPRYCNVKSEFRRVIKAYDETDAFEFYDSVDRARRSFEN